VTSHDEPIPSFTHIKPDNCLIFVEFADEAIARLLEESSSGTYEPAIESEA
jgi:hypothetical protein